MTIPKLLSAMNTYSQVLSRLRENRSLISIVSSGAKALTSSAIVVGLFIPSSLASCTACEIRAMRLAHDGLLGIRSS